MEREREGERGREDGEGREGGREREDGERMEGGWRGKGKEGGRGRGREGGREGERMEREREREREGEKGKEGGREKGRSETDYRSNGAAQTTHAQFDFRIPQVRRGPPTYKNCFGCVRVASHSLSFSCLSDISALTIEQFSISPPPADPEWLKRKQQAKFREELPL